MLKLFWRFASGAHLDGVKRMNNSWARNGTMPRHHDNWWNRKSRFRKMGWRWGVTAAIILETWFLVAFLIPALIVTGAVILYGLSEALRAVQRAFRSERPRRVAVEQRSQDERGIIDNIGAVEYSGGAVEAPVPYQIRKPDPGNVGGGVLQNNPFFKARTSNIQKLIPEDTRKDEAG